MNWKKITLISLGIFVLGFVIMGSQNEMNIIASIGAITIFLSIMSPLIIKLWMRPIKSKISKVVLGIIVVLFVFLITMAIMPKTASKTNPEVQTGSVRR